MLTRRSEGTRPYHSPVRAAQKAATRQRILDVLSDHMAAGTFDSVSMDAIAQAAGVSPATLYRHFPSRDALLDAIADEALFQRVGDVPYPQAPHEIAPIMRLSFEAFDTDREFIRAYFSTELGRTARTRGRRRRVEAMQEALRPITEGLEASRRRGAEAVIAYLASIQAWITMGDEFGLSGEQVGEAVTWAIDTLLADLQARRDEATQEPTTKGANRDRDRRGNPARGGR
jgi:AcrR family transcriptional regulator